MSKYKNIAKISNIKCFTIDLCILVIKKQRTKLENVVEQAIIIPLI